MYTKLSAEDFKRKLDLPKDYQVEGLLAYGIWDLYAKEKHLPHLKKRGCPGIAIRNCDRRIAFLIFT